MADQNIALGVQVPDSFKSISGMLNFANQAQEFQRGNVRLQQEKALLQPNIEAGQAQSETAKTNAASAKFKLTKEQAGQAMDLIGGYAQDPRINDPEGAIQVAKELRERMITNGVPESQAEWQASQISSRAHQPGAVEQLIQNTIRQNAGAASQAGVVNAPLTPISTGSGIQLTQTQPGAQGGAGPRGAPMPITLPPGAVETTETGPDKQQYIVTRSPQGTILGTRPLAGGPTGGTGGGAGMPKFSPGDAESIPALEQERNSARQALTMAPDLHQNARGVLDEIEKVSATGQTGPLFQKINSALGGVLDWSSAEKRASSFDLVGKYLERQALQIAQTMGPHTNSGLESVKASSGSTAYNPTAIKKIVKLTDANITGTEAYQPGLEKAIAADPQRGVLAKREFDQAWGQNYDPRITMLTNAKKNGDRQEYNDIMKSMNAQQYQELMTKARNLDRLSKQGRL